MHDEERPAAHTARAGRIEGRDAVVLASPAAGGIAATVVPSAGAVVSSLHCAGAELLGQRDGLTAYAAGGAVMGIPLLYPWANRLDAPTAGGAPLGDSPLVRSEQHGLPIHGFSLADATWSAAVVDAGPDAAAVACTLDLGMDARRAALFPCPHRLVVLARLAGDALTLATRVEPTGDAPVPIAFGWHPYLRVPDVAREEWVLDLPLERHAVLDERLLPTGAYEPAGTLSGPLGGRTFDDLYAADDARAVCAVAGGPWRIEVALGGGYTHLQVYAPANDDVVAIEPMTAPGNALASGEGLRHAAPGEPFEAVFAVRIAQAPAGER
jgi:galactose mutarotase-like enzyme